MVCFLNVIICIAVMWSMVLLFYNAGFVHGYMKLSEITMWSFFTVLLSWSIYIQDCEISVSVIAVSYLVVSAYIDSKTRDVYTFFSMTAAVCVMIAVFIKVYPQWNNVLYITAISVYLKILEKSGAYGGGDTDYMLVVHLLYMYMYDEASYDITIFTLIMSLLVHYICYSDMKREKYPLTPCILAVVITIFIIKGKMFNGFI